MSPLISVIMPVYNGKKYLIESIESILSQQEEDFEFLIFDDGSTDDSWSIISSYKDPRIVALHCQKRKGYVVHLNEGIRMAKGTYIARMDADDISHALRFRTQVNFLKRNSHVGICGTWMELFGEKGTSIISYPQGSESIRAFLLFDTCFAHPTVMMRSSVAKKLFYNEHMLPVEDYDLWTRAAKITELDTIPEVLYRYRQHQKQVSTMMSSRQRKITEDIRKKEFFRYYPGATSKDIDLFLLLCKGGRVKDHVRVSECSEWVSSLRMQDIWKKDKTGTVSSLVSQRWFSFCFSNALLHGISLLSIYRKGVISSLYRPSYADYMLFVLYAMCSWIYPKKTYI